MSEWIEHSGDGMPVPGDTRVEVRFRDGDILTGTAALWNSEGDDGTNWRFLKSDPDFDIVAYRIITNPDSAPTP